MQDKHENVPVIPPPFEQGLSDAAAPYKTRKNPNFSAKIAHNSEGVSGDVKSAPYCQAASMFILMPRAVMPQPTAQWDHEAYLGHANRSVWPASSERRHTRALSIICTSCMINEAAGLGRGY